MADVSKNRPAYPFEALELSRGPGHDLTYEDWVELCGGDEIKARYQHEFGGDVFDGADVARFLRERLNQFAHGLAADPASIAALPSTTAESVFTFLFDVACRTPGASTFTLAANYLLGLPRSWATQRLTRVLATLEFEKEQAVFVRVLELCVQFEGVWPLPRSPESPLDALLRRCSSSTSIEVRRAASMYVAELHRLPQAAPASQGEVQRAFKRMRPTHETPPLEELPL